MTSEIPLKFLRNVRIGCLEDVLELAQLFSDEPRSFVISSDVSELAQKFGDEAVLEVALIF